MPIYEYHCAKCDKTFEVTQKISDAPLKTCIHCKGKARRIISRTSFALKGGGWYADGYAGKGPAGKDKKKPEK